MIALPGRRYLYIFRDLLSGSHKCFFWCDRRQPPSLSTWGRIHSHS